GAKLPTMRILTKRFDVSVITISKALRTLEKEGHVNCVTSVGTFVNIPKTESAGSNILPQISFITVSLDSCFTQSIATSIEKACRKKSWTLQINNSHFDSNVERNYLAKYERLGSKGAIVFPVADDKNLETLFNLKIRNFPFVVIDRPIRGLKVDTVRSDHEKGAYLATQYLLQHGHRRVFILTYSQGQFYSVDARMRGYERALIDHGIEPQPEWKIIKESKGDTFNVEEEDPSIHWCKIITPLLKSLDKPVAIFTLNASVARILLEVCRELGLGIPQDISIVTFDDNELMQAYNPPITVIAQRTHQIGKAAVELLERRMQNKNSPEPQQVVIDVDLIERGSVSRAI
ncbi:MAG: substrate-binding domain-containing protein, partial [Planctomycetota bacterium]